MPGLCCIQSLVFFYTFRVKFKTAAQLWFSIDDYFKAAVLCCNQLYFIVYGCKLSRLWEDWQNWQTKFINISYNCVKCFFKYD